MVPWNRSRDGVATGAPGVGTGERAWSGGHGGAGAGLGALRRPETDRTARTRARARRSGTRRHILLAREHARSDLGSSKRGDWWRLLDVVACAVRIRIMRCMPTMRGEPGGVRNPNQGGYSRAGARSSTRRRLDHRSAILSSRWSFLRFGHASVPPRIAGTRGGAYLRPDRSASKNRGTHRTGAPSERRWNMSDLSFGPSVRIRATAGARSGRSMGIDGFGSGRYTQRPRGTTMVPEDRPRALRPGP